MQNTIFLFSRYVVRVYSTPCTHLRCTLLDVVIIETSITKHWQPFKSVLLQQELSLVYFSKRTNHVKRFEMWNKANEKPFNFLCTYVMVLGPIKKTSTTAVDNCKCAKVSSSFSAKTVPSTAVRSSKQQLNATTRQKSFSKFTQS